MSKNFVELFGSFADEGLNEVFSDAEILNVRITNIKICIVEIVYIWLLLSSHLHNIIIHNMRCILHGKLFSWWSADGGDALYLRRKLPDY